MTKLVHRLPAFNGEGVDDANSFDRIAASAKAAHAGGGDTVFVVDDCYQLPWWRK